MTIKRTSKIVNSVASTSRRQNTRITEFHWVRDVTEFAEVEEHISGGLVPVIAPSCAKRRARWTEVLEWYGLKPGKPDVSYHRAAVEAVECGSGVIALDDEFSGLAKSYARALGRPYFQLSSASDARKAIEDCTLSSMVVIASPQSLPGELLQSINQSVSVPWGVLTAIDIAGLSFQMAKQLLGNQPANQIGFLDAMNHSFHRIEDDQIVTSSEVDSQMVSKMINQQSWHTLAVSAHGEGGHINLNSIVLCGLLSDHEHLSNGREIDGCRIEGTRRICKRVTDETINTVAVADIRCEQLVFFSCTGFVLHDLRYPTNINCILSAAEGYPRAVAATDRLTFIDPYIPKLMLGLLDQTVDLAPALHCINGLHARRFRWRPYMLCGDATESDIAVLTTTVGATISLPPCHIVPFTLADDPEPTILACNKPGVDVDIVRSANGGGVLMQGQAKEDCQFQLIDATDRYQDQLAWFEDIGNRLARAAWIERAALRLCDAQLAHRKDFREAMAGLLAIRLKLERNVQGSIGLCRSAEFHGIWYDSIDKARESAAEQVSAWDLQLIKIVDKYLLDFGDIPNILTDGFTGRKGSNDHSCDYCGAQITQIQLESPLGDQPALFQTDCPSCARWENWTERIPRLEVTCPDMLEPSIPVNIEVTCRPAPSSASMAVSEGYVVVQLEDKSIGKTVLGQFRSTSDDSVSITCTLPTGLSSDLHTFSVAWVQGLDVAFHRRRAACFRPIERIS